MVLKTIYVGNLPWATTEDELASVFAEKTGVEVQASRIITDRETGRSRGFGFVEVAEDDMEKALEAMQGVELDGRELVVNEARQRQNRF
ncbi:MAG TPA: RNA-binding protein [Firmicutes bacterium]|nr:RNA-binding protein [Bacillota bacterium]